MDKELMQTNILKTTKKKLQEHASDLGITLTALLTIIINDYIKKEKL